MAFDPLADIRQGFAERGEALVLGSITYFAPPRVVEVLLAAARVASGGLNVALRIGTDPNVGPRGRDHQMPDAQENGWVRDARDMPWGAPPG